MSRPSRRSLEQRLAEGVVIGAEGYVFELEKRGYIKAGPYVPEVILDAPEALYGGAVAAPVFKRMSEELFTYLRIPPTEPRPTPRPTGAAR